MAGSRLRLALTVGAVSAGLALAAWRYPRSGGPCRSGARCDGRSAALVCRDGRYLTVPCRGEKGCRIEQDELLCDTSDNRQGDACCGIDDGGSEGQCGSDGKSLVLCDGGTIARVPCRGARGCERRAKSARCDNSIARADDPCQAPGMACLEDGSSVVSCVDGKLRPVQSCRGPRGCTVITANEKLDCDSVLARVGDPCLEEGTGACSEDRRSVLACKGARYAESKACLVGEDCATDGHDFRCRRSMAKHR